MFSKNHLLSLLLGIIALGIIWGIGQVDELKTTIRYAFFLLMWIISIVAVLFYDLDTKSFEFSFDWPDVIFRIVGVIIWTILFYLAAFPGIGLQEGPWETP